MKQLSAIFMFLAMASAVYAQIIEQQTVNYATGRAPMIETFQSNARTYEWTVLNGTEPVNLSDKTPFMWWSPSLDHEGIVAAEITVISESGGVFRAAFDPEDLNYVTARGVYGVGTQPSGGPATARQGIFRIIADPFAAGVDPVVFGTNMLNWSQIYGAPPLFTPTDLDTDYNTDWMYLTNAIAVGGGGVLLEADPVFTAWLAETSILPGGDYYQQFFDWSFAKVYVGSADVTATNSWYDRFLLHRRIDVAESAFDFVVFDFRDNDGTNNLALSLSDESVAVIDGTTVRYVSDGTATVTGVFGDMMRSAEIVMDYEYDKEVVDITSGIDGSYRKAVMDLVGGLADAGGDLNIYSTYTPADSNYVRNTGMWAYDLDLTCAPAWNSRRGNRRFSPTLISSNAAIGANHANIALYVGDTLHFVDNDNTTHVRTITERRTLSDPASAWGVDIALYKLNSPLPPSITPAKLHGSASRQYYVVQSPDSIPVVWVDQDNTARVNQMDTGWSNVKGQSATSDRYTNVYKYAVSGDSGSPLLMFDVESNPVYTFGFRSSTSGTDPLSNLVPFGWDETIAEAVVAAITDMGAEMFEAFNYDGYWQLADPSVPSYPPAWPE